MELLFKDDVIGEIENTYSEDYWIHGDFRPAGGYYKYVDFFEAIVCEEGIDETKFSQELFNENNWFVKDNNKLKEIWIPAIYSDGDVSIRYR